MAGSDHGARALLVGLRPADGDAWALPGHSSRFGDVAVQPRLAPPSRRSASTAPYSDAPLSDSPVGLASWILEKWYNWSDHDGDIEKAFTKDELLTNIMIYWVTNSGTSSSRIYFESRTANPRSRQC